MWPLVDHPTAVRILVPIALAAAIALAVAGGLAARRIVLALPTDVLDDDRPLPPGHVVAKMAVGIALVVLGVTLLVLPGPGLLFIAPGLLTCAPGWRRRIVRSVVARPRVLRELNAFRRRHGRPPVSDPGEPRRAVDPEGEGGRPSS